MGYLRALNAGASLLFIIYVNMMNLPGGICGPVEAYHLADGLALSVF